MISRGNAALAAAEAVKKEILDVAAIMLNAQPSEIALREGRAWVNGDGDRSLLFADIAAYAVNKLGHPLSGKGHYDDPVAPTAGLDKGHGEHILSHTFACQIAEVEIDSKTGTIKVLNVVASHDTGTTINTLMAEGQIEGSVVQGTGYALTEEAVEVDGKMQNPRFLDYKTWSAADIPPIKVILVESNDPDGPFGAKGIGEPGLVPTASAIGNAIFHATGKRFFELPMNAERVFYRLQED
ncbi:xanthine dehydrogenase family protein molybdopterin-binding subunit [Pelotomaculum propionicicum]|uniref:Nicotinate dehydrogenase medium molybdopterin subunit n=1 Tax=Pelotomaculum propionicicum TaxID=258475 RepID=A0A4Y7RJW1_9FIRM|nr:molybdopterin cofactor-binding domain-containing protein [Pelotomaculum propionicicum]NLI11342.1 xanthine dehydrogenase family protein molybdopterin-binding subunit [Peptococcaceae bacterium]TEB08962.1 Nicotinate dehydrogenase medium molybdopterin subunit [Pelotomaculum propionicicum]